MWCSALTRLVRGVVDQDVDSSKFVDSALALASLFFKQGPHFVRIVVFLQRCDQNVRALPREGDGYGAADAAVPPVITAFLPASLPEPL
jgi:hypothetical protein